MFSRKKLLYYFDFVYNYRSFRFWSAQNRELPCFTILAHQLSWYDCLQHKLKVINLSGFECIFRLEVFDLTDFIKQLISKILNSWKYELFVALVKFVNGEFRGRPFLVGGTVLVVCVKYSSKIKWGLIYRKLFEQCLVCHND